LHPSVRLSAHVRQPKPPRNDRTLERGIHSISLRALVEALALERATKRLQLTRCSGGEAARCCLLSVRIATDAPCLAGLETTKRTGLTYQSLGLSGTGEHESVHGAPVAVAQLLVQEQGAHMKEVPRIPPRLGDPARHSRRTISLPGEKRDASRRQIPHNKVSQTGRGGGGGNQRMGEHGGRAILTGRASRLRTCMRPRRQREKSCF